jgi:hypothetical protein
VTARCAASSTKPTSRSPELLTEHREQLEQLTRALLAAERLDAMDAYAAVGVGLKMPAHA